MAEHSWLTTRSGLFYLRAPVPIDIIDTLSKTHRKMTNPVVQRRGAVHPCQKPYSKVVHDFGAGHRPENLTLNWSEIEPNGPVRLAGWFRSLT